MLSYYPGCTVRAQEPQFEEEAFAILHQLGFYLEELTEWECCGAIFPLSRDEFSPFLPGSRAIKNAHEANSQGLLTLCSACYHVLKRVDYRMKTDDHAKRRVESYLQDEYQNPNYPVENQNNVLHISEVLRDLVGLEKLQKHAKYPLEGQKIAVYYGCLLLRPSQELGLTNPENPQILEEIIKALGGEVVQYPYSQDCCGAYHVYNNAPITETASNKVVTAARESGAHELVTACPLCKHNLESVQENDSENMTKLPVNFITSPVIRALGVSQWKGGKKIASTSKHC